MPLDQESETATKKDTFRNSSGFFKNSMICDGRLFVTEKTMHSDMVRTAYRNQFNTPKPFQPLPAPITIGKLKKRELVYDLQDK